MSTLTTPLRVPNTTIYSSKGLLEPARARYGHTGWNKDEDGALVEVVFVQPPGENCPTWIPVDIYRRMIDDQRERNRRYALANPNHVRKKIADKRKRRSLHRLPHTA